MCSALYPTGISNLQIGSLVHSKAHLSGTMQPAHIARVNADGTYDIVFDDGTATIMKALGIDELYVLTTTDPSAPLAARGRGAPGGSSNDSKEGEGQRSDMDVREVMSVEEELARITQEAEAERVKLSLAMEMEAARQKKVMRRKLQRRRKRRNSIQNIKMNQGHGGEGGGGRGGGRASAELSADWLAQFGGVWG